MIDKAVIFFEQIDEKVTEIKFSEILRICVTVKGLPKNKGDLYFLVSSFEALKLLTKLPKQKYKINWDQFHKLKSEAGFDEQ